MKNKRIIAFVLTLIITLGLIVIPAQAAGLDQIKNGEMNETSNGALSSWEPVLISAAGCDDNTTSRQTGNVNIGGTQFNATNGAYAMGLSSEVGSISVGKRANFFITKPIPSVEFLPYAYTSPLVSRVFLGGQEV